MNNDWLNNNKIYFYIPKSDYCEDFPSTAKHYWIGFRRGIYCWTLQTYLRLKEVNFPCVLVNEIPSQGIIIAHWDSLPINIQPNSQQLIICIQADRARHSYAQIHIIQNREGLRKNLMMLGDSYLLPGGIYYIPHWPQPGLIPRNLSRDYLFQNIGYLGLEKNLLPELKTENWHTLMRDLKLNWIIVNNFQDWNNYTNIDAILAVRSFYHSNYSFKPATKLYNAWLAGVPAILGKESAFQAERKSELDYIEVSSLDEVLAALKLLRDNPELRQKMIENGFERAKEYSPVIITEYWKNLIVEKLIPAYEYWCNNPLYRQSFLLRRELAINTRPTRKKLQQLRNQLGIRTKIRNLFSNFNN